MAIVLTREDLFYIQNNPEKVLDYLQELEAASGGAVTWASITGKPTTFAPSTHQHAISDITNLQTTLNGKLTASKAAAQANSTATDVAGIVADFNALLSKLKAAGIQS